MSLVARLKGIASESTFHVLIALCMVHCFNDLLQSVITAVYPMLKADLNLSFGQIGLITLVYQIASSVFQPVVGLAFDRRPFVGSLPMGMVSTTFGIMLFAYSWNLATVLLSVFLVGIGSSTLHPEASRITSLASHGRRGLAQSIFQVGGNFGTSVGPLLVALIVAPNGRSYIIWRPICVWYRGYLKENAGNSRSSVHMKRPLSLRRTVFVISVLMVLIFSKYVAPISANAITGAGSAGCSPSAFSIQTMSNHLPNL